MYNGTADTGGIRNQGYSNQVSLTPSLAELQLGSGRSNRHPFLNSRDITMEMYLNSYLQV